MLLLCKILHNVDSHFEANGTNQVPYMSEKYVAARKSLEERLTEYAQAQGRKCFLLANMIALDENRLRRTIIAIAAEWWAPQAFRAWPDPFYS